MTSDSVEVMLEVCGRPITLTGSDRATQRFADRLRAAMDRQRAEFVANRISRSVPIA